MTEKRTTELKDEHKQARISYNESRNALATSKECLLAASEAATILQEVASHVQRCWYEHLGRIVSKCLAAVFEDSYEFKLVFKQLSNRTQVQFLFERDMEEFDPLTSTGGGVVDVASFALRIAAMMLGAEDYRRLLIVDEPFRFVSVKYRPGVRLLLEKLSDEFSMQLIMVTHMEELEVGDVIHPQSDTR